MRNSPQNQLSMPHIGLQRWKPQSQSLNGFELGPLHVPHGCVMGALIGLLTVGVGADS